MPNELFHITTRTPHSSDLCMECEQAKTTIYVFLLGIFQLRLCQDCLAQLRVEIGKVLEGKCSHEWGTDGQHSNEFCKKCFVSRPK